MIEPHASECATTRIELIQGDITRLAVDAVVNAANEALAGGGGVDGAIHRAAGPRLAQACRVLPQVRPFVRCPTGEARITPGFDLPALHIIHAVGPVWRGGRNGEHELLDSCYRHALALAASHGLDSIAFPAISCGVFGYPLEQAAAIALSAARDWRATGKTPRRIVFCLFGDDALSAYQRTWARINVDG